MKLPILFQSLDRIDGKEGRSKLLLDSSKLYLLLHALKKEISKEYTVGSDRMDLHIEITKERRDPEFKAKATVINGQIVDLADPKNWGYLGRAFVLWTPESEGYGRTHSTVSFFGNNPRPEVDVLVKKVLDFIDKAAI